MIRGYKIVLTADRTLMSEYSGGIFLGFSACVPKGLIPDQLYFTLFCPSVEVNRDGSVKYAPCGTRKVEAALLNHGFKSEEVIVAHPDHLDKVIGPNTKAVGITETDPLGMGPATTTFVQLFGGEAYMSLKFRELLNHPFIKRYNPRIIVGGAGAWQLKDREVRSRLGIDCVVVGEGEKVVGLIFEKAVNGEQIPEIIFGEVVPEDEIPLIRGPTIDGIVEISRGCGRGCDFCVPTLQRYRCLPIKHILKEVEVNLKAGRRPLLHAEDVLRYKAKGLKINRDAVINLFEAVTAYPGVDKVALSHFTLSSIASRPDVVEDISNMLDLGNGKWLSGQTGIETGSPKLIKDHMMGKCKPFKTRDWPQVVIDSFEIMSKNHWVPCATLIIGLPGETNQDIDLTIELVEQLKSFKSIMVPLFLISEGGLENRAESFTLEKMTTKHSEFFMKCWEHNLNWGHTLLNEWGKMCIDSRAIRYGLKLSFSYGIKQAMKIVRMCRDDYDYDISNMIQDIENGKKRVAPLLTRVVRPILRLRGQ